MEIERFVAGLRILAQNNVSTANLTRPAANAGVVVAHDSPDYHVAFPGLCVTADGDLLCVFRQGLTHAGSCGDDGRIVAIRSGDEGATWSEPWVLVDDPAYDDRNAAVETGPDGRIALCWDKYLAPHHYGAWLALSEDGGRSFAPATKVGVRDDVHTRSRPVWVDASHLMVPYSESVAESENCASYLTHVDLQSGEQEDVAISRLGDRGPADETALAYNVDGSIIALIRDNEQPWLWQTQSNDGGFTWAELWQSEIPSQFTPCDLLQADGLMVCSFSFRQRRNERLIVSRDGGRSWDTENSVDVFAATPGISDRSYPATVHMPSGALGTVLYESRPHPRGGRIYFCTNSMSQFDAPRETCLYADGRHEPALLMLRAPDGDFEVAAAYRFTGLFGTRPHRVGWDVGGGGATLALSYFMGVSPDRWCDFPEGVEAAVERDGSRSVVLRQPVSANFCDGREHTLTLRRNGRRCILAVDAQPLLEMEMPHVAQTVAFRVAGAAVAVYGITARVVT